MAYFKVVFGIGDNQKYCYLRAATFYQAFSYAYNKYNDLQSVTIINTPSIRVRECAREV